MNSEHSSLRKKTGEQAQEKIFKCFYNAVIAQKNLEFYDSIIENQHD